MLFLTKLVFKNLFRSKSRTIVSVIAIAFAVMVVVFAKGLIDGMIESVTADHIYYHSGHIKVVDGEYQKRERLLTLDYPVDGLAGQGLEEMISSLQQVEGVEMVIPRLKFGAMVSTEEELVAMSGWGVNPDQELAFTDLEDLLVEGRMVTPGRLEVVMGSKLLAKLDRRVGDEVTILFNTAFDSLRGVTFRIVGRLETGLKILNELAFYLPLDQAQQLLYMDDQVTELLLVTSDKKLVPRVLPRVQALLAERDDRYRAFGYRETSDLIPLMDLSAAIFKFVYIFLVLLSCIVVINTMFMIVKDRTKEIGMMSALGLESKDIMRLFILEGTVMGVAGSLCGAAFGHLLNIYLSKVGFDYGEALSGMSSEVIFDTMLYPVSSLSNTIFAFALGTVVVAIACLIPARRAARLEPTEAMRE
ncbi:MAG TPA: FtsX-like permease family protein [Bacillota bacterium]